jgi:hypothetical protein
VRGFFVTFAHNQKHKVMFNRRIKRKAAFIEAKHKAEYEYLENNFREVVTFGDMNIDFYFKKHNEIWLKYCDTHKVGEVDRMLFYNRNKYYAESINETYFDKLLLNLNSWIRKKAGVLSW